MRFNYRSEFPSFDYDIPQIPEGFADMSWRNDVCPSFTRKLNETQEMVLWVDFADENRRECGGRQFTLVIQEIDNETDPLDFVSEFDTNSWDEMLNKISSITQGEIA
jgi:hypothetical protein